MLIDISRLDQRRSQPEARRGICLVYDLIPKFFFFFKKKKKEYCLLETILRIHLSLSHERFTLLI